MKTNLFWFSGSGNTFWAAKAVAEGLGDTDMVPIASPDAAKAAPAQRIGIAFPVYGFGPPEIVKRFVAEIPADKAQYVFLLMTYGMSPGPSADQARKLLAKRGVSLAAAYGVRLPDNYPPFGGAPPTDKQGRLFEASHAKIAEIVEAIKQSTQGRYDRSNLLFNLLGKLIHPMFAKRMAKADRKFSADEKCNKCGICERVCPVGNIELVEGRPTWLGHCEQCYACFHWCPQSAIQYGRKSERQERYHHPGCKLKDMLVRDPEL